MDILTTIAGHILTLEFNRPEKKNAITAAMYEAMTAAIEQAQTDASVRVVVIHGKAEIFTSGNDLKDFVEHPPSDETSPVYRFLRAISHLDKPLLAAVRGAAVGVGCTLLLHCDLVYAAESATFCLPFVKLGLVPEAASSLLLPLRAGHQRAAQCFFFGDILSADGAREMGMVTEILADGIVLEYTLAQATRLVGLPTTAVRATKRLLKQHQTEAIDRRMKEEAHEFRLRLSSAEAKEAFAAFFEHRTPDFSRLP